MKNLIVFATYWNEADWIDASLDQILRIDPVEVIICDGNFDPRFENYSTDGTRETIKQFVKENKNRVRMISAVRAPPYLGGLEFIKNAGRSEETIKPIRCYWGLRSQLITNPYRINQALTFARMMNLSNKWEIGRWVMSYDADQFYTDELIDFFSVANQKTDFDLITADELTFPYDFFGSTYQYEFRKWNNMPHKIKPNMAVYPTRHYMIEYRFSVKKYHAICKVAHGGTYHHYKFRKNTERLRAGYMLGDRNPPEGSRYSSIQAYRGPYPSVIAKYFDSELRGKK